MGINRKKVRSKAQKQVRKGNWKKAIGYYEDLVDDDAGDVRSRLKLADLYTRIGKEDEAIQSCKRDAAHHASQDFFQKAVAVYKQAIRLQPNDGDLHRRVGEAYHRMDRLKDAAQAFKKAHRCYKEEGEVDAQLDVLEESVRIDPEDVGLQIQLAETYSKQGERDLALETFRTAASMLEEEGRVDDYAQVAERILYFDPDDVRVRKKAIDTYLGRNDYKRALKHLQVCFNSDAHDTDILRPLASTFLELDRVDKAVLVFHQLGRVLKERDQMSRARQVWKRILEIDPDNAKAQKSLEAYGGTRQPPQSQTQRATDSGSLPAISEPDDGGVNPDTLDGIEFIDEEPERGPRTPAPQHNVDETTKEPLQTEPPEREPASNNPGAANSPAASNRPEPNDPAPNNPAIEDGPEEGIVDLSEAIQPVEPGEAPDGLGEEDSEISEKLSEAEVFLKYGLYDNAREVIQDILSREPENLAAFEKRRQLYSMTGEPTSEAATLVEMAKIAGDQPERAREYLEDALAIGRINDAVRDAANGLGITLDELPADETHVPPAADSDVPLGAVEDTEILPVDEEETEDEDEPLELKEVVDEGVEETGVMELDPDEVEIIEDEAGDEVTETGGEDFSEFEEFAEVTEDIVKETELVDDGGFEEAELEDVSDLTEETSPPGRDEPASARMAQTEFEDPAASGFDFTEQEVEGALDDLFESFAEDEEPLNIGADDPSGELAQVDNYIQQGLYDDAIEALEEFERSNPGHPGVDKRYYQIKTARQGGRVEDNPSGAASLSKKFDPLDTGEHEIQPPPNENIDLDTGVLNSSLELGAAYRDMGMYDEAIKEFEDALDDPEAANEAKYHIAVCKAEKGATEEALDTLETLLERADLSGALRNAARSKIDELDTPRA